MGTNNITTNDIENYLENRPESKNIYKAGRGATWIAEAKQNAELANFDYYYSRMKKMTLMRGYEACGMNMRWLYDPDEIFDEKKKKAQEDYLDSLSLQEIADLIDCKVENVKAEFIDNATDEATLIGETVFDILEGLKEKPEIGMTLYGDYVNNLHRGARLGKFYLRSAPSGVGKAIPNDTLIPTPLGWRKVGDIKPGDKLFGQDGKETTVLQIYPQKQKKEIWNITFSDGRVAKCCGEHLWEYRYESHRGYKYRVEDIQTIHNRAKSLKNGLKNSDGKGYRFHIKLNEPVEYEEKQYLIPPYAMGALLGDGSFRYNDNNKSFEFSSENEQIPELIVADINSQWQKEKAQTIYAKKSSDKNYSWTFRDRENPKHPLWVEELLKDYPELLNVKSEDKFIPIDYLQGSIAQRYQLLQGLMDTDGSIDERGRTSFTTISQRLRDDFIELCRSLGFIATYSIDSRDKYTTGKCYKIHIQASKEMKQHFFRLERKYNIAKTYLAQNKREEYKDHLAIVNIEKTDKLSDMTCFTVDNSDHLFLMNDYIVTHNTRTMIADACTVGADEIYDPNKKEWVKTYDAQPVLYISTELDTEEVTTMCLAFLSGVNENHILMNEYEFGEYDRVLYAARLLQRSPIYIEEMPDFSIKSVENVIKRSIRTKGVQYCFFDYLHSSLGILREISRASGGTKLREDNILFLFSVALKDIANNFNIFILSSTQLNMTWKTDDIPDQNLLRGSKAIADRVDWGSILLDVTQEDREALENLIPQTPHQIMPNVKLSVYKNRRGSYNKMYLWMYADKGTCRFDGLFATDYDYNPIKLKKSIEAGGE